MPVTLRREDTTDEVHAFGQQDEIRIGRIAGNDVVLSVSHISSRHAVIRLREGRYFIADLGSTNGSVVMRHGDRLVLGARGHAEVALENGDLLVLGDVNQAVRLRVVLESAQVDLGGNTIVATRGRNQTAEISRRLASDNTALQAVFRLVAEINQAINREQVLQRVVQAALEAFPGAVDALVVVDQGGRWAVGAQAHRGAGHAREPNDKICHDVKQSGKAVLFGQGSAALPAMTLASCGIGEGIAAPLWQEQQVVGVLQINCSATVADRGQASGRAATAAASGDGPHGLGEMQLELAVVFAHHAAEALQRAELIARLRRAEAQLREENSFLRERAQPTVEMIGNSPVMQRVVEELTRAASSDVTVLLQGETGTGKEVAARYLHAQSRRAGGLLVPVNCGALTETLLDSELFGHKKGAFTGATADRKGVFEVAAGGTVFLDEVGEMPAPVQVRLLRVLEEGKIKRVGEAVERPVDVRIVAASNRDLAALVQQSGFRQDLYYRLRVFPIALPPLRARREDIEPLCRHFVARYAEQLGKHLGPIDGGFFETLRAYAFPGNVRELANELERVIVRLDDGAELTAELLSEEILAAAGSPSAQAGKGPPSLREQVDHAEREIIVACLRRHGSHKVKTATELGLTRQGLAKKIQRLAIGELK